jgi:ubiquinone/menaquinone biosynthesis C-methylase UbiE
MTRLNEEDIPNETFDFLGYVHIKLWSSFYYQLVEILSITGARGEAVLEIGKGTGVLGGVLKEFGILYESLDVNGNLQPTHVGSVVKMPFKDKSYDVIGCFEVLEHLPYEQFETAISELCRVARKAVIVSLPDAKRMFSFYFYIPRIVHKKILIPCPFFNPDKHDMCQQHHWEINRKQYSVKIIRETIIKIANQQGFLLQKEYRAWENPYHHFFVLKNRL